MDALQDLGNVQGGTGLLEYVVRHVDLRQTCVVRGRGSCRGTAPKTANRPQLGLESGLEYRENGILEIVGQMHLRSQGAGGKIAKAGRSVNKNISLPDLNVETPGKGGAFPHSRGAKPPETPRFVSNLDSAGLYRLRKNS
jgi:hypothetical protein